MIAYMNTLVNIIDVVVVDIIIITYHPQCHNPGGVKGVGVSPYSHLEREGP